MRIASCTRSLRSPASAKPRSTNTSPEPVSTFSRFLAITHLVILARRLQAPPYQIHVRLSGAHARWRLLLKAVQHIHRLLEAHRVHRPPSPDRKSTRLNSSPWPSRMPSSACK